MTGEAPSGADARRPQWLKGLAELALLSVLRDRPRYGLEILERLRTDAGLAVAGGTIYPLLHRLEHAGAIASEWRIEAGGAPPRKYYVLTADGRGELESATDDWRRLSAGLTGFLDRGPDHD